MKRELDPEGILQSIRPSAQDIIDAAAQGNTELLEHKNTKTPEPVKKKGRGRPKGAREATINLKLTWPQKEYLRKRAYEETHGSVIVTMADIIEELIDNDMRKYERKHGSTGKAEE